MRKERMKSQSKDEIFPIQNEKKKDRKSYSLFRNYVSQRRNFSVVSAFSIFLILIFHTLFDSLIYPSWIRLLISRFVWSYQIRSISISQPLPLSTLCLWKRIRAACLSSFLSTSFSVLPSLIRGISVSGSDKEAREESLIIIFGVHKREWLNLFFNYNCSKIPLSVFFSLLLLHLRRATLSVCLWARKSVRLRLSSVWRISHSLDIRKALNSIYWLLDVPNSINE